MSYLSVTPFTVPVCLLSSRHYCTLIRLSRCRLARVRCPHSCRWGPTQETNNVLEAENVKNSLEFPVDLFELPDMGVISEIVKARGVVAALLALLIRSRNKLHCHAVSHHNRRSRLQNCA